MVSHEGSVCLKGVQKWKKLCEYLFGYICKAFGLLIQTDLVQASTLLVSLRKKLQDIILKLNTCILRGSFF